MKRSLLVLAACLLGWPVLHADAPRAKPEEKAKPVVVPFEILPSGHMTVMVKINGKGPYKLIFDTGAPITLMNNKIARESGLLKDVRKPLITLFGSMGDVKVPELDVAGVKVENTSAVIMDHPTVEAISSAFEKTAGPIHGIVGFPFFARFRTTLDYQAKTMTLVPSGYDAPDTLQSLQKALMAGLTGSEGPTVLRASATWGLTVNKKTGDDEAGVTVTRVLPGGPAAEAGLKEGDRLLTLDGRWTDSVADTYRAAGSIKAGTPTTAVIRRDGKEMKLSIKPISGL